MTGIGVHGQAHPVWPDGRTQDMAVWSGGFPGKAGKQRPELIGAGLGLDGRGQGREPGMGDIRETSHDRRQSRNNEQGAVASAWTGGGFGLGHVGGLGLPPVGLSGEVRKGGCKGRAEPVMGVTAWI